MGVFVGPCPVPLLFCCFSCGETQIWLGDLRVAFVVLRFLCGWVVRICHFGPFGSFSLKFFTAYAIVRTEPSALSATPEEKLDDGWPESEKDVFQAALSMVVVKNSR